MSDLMDNQVFGGNYYSRDNDGHDEDEDNDSDFFAGGYAEDSDLLKLGGKKEENEMTFSVESASQGSYTGGRFVSTSSYNAAKKAATAIFKQLDKEVGKVKKAAKGANKNHAKKVEFVLYRHDKKKAVKFYKYEAERIQADEPVVVKRTLNKGKSNEKIVTISFSQKITIHPVELDAEYVERNKEEQKVFAAKKRAAKRKAEVATNPEKKQRKPKAAAKAKKPKKVASLQDVIDALTGPKKAEKKPKTEKATKKAKAEKATKKAKAVKGGGYCSFF